MTATTPYTPFRLATSHNLESTGYILDVQVSPHGGNLVAPTSSGAVHVFDAGTLEGVNTLNVTDGSSRDVLSEVAFDTANPSLLWSGSKSGHIKLWDLRSGEAGLTLDGRSYMISARAPVLCLAVNSTRTLLAAGTELVGEDAMIPIWDIRAHPTPATTFMECHSDDITQLRFHPSDPNAMISGSTDGLICLYNLATLEEDDALYQVIKEDSISKIGFFGPAYEYIYCLSHMETFSLYKFLEGDKVFSFGDVRADSEAQQMKVDYLIDCVYDAAGQRMFLVTGDQSGNMGVLHVNLGRLELVHTINGGHTDIVRGVHWDLQRGSLVSGGEDGIVSLWQNS
ncbi:WD40-repeat-containing domain protein [Fimicolochytrium jonesii]|uniref:WD40-repeat-containing domain protein n=1 Tax=Fimicolochytrium jonesii TaxID=1396493 RepID=UPI0022FEDC46|nr:WD40-repeat-containing domain protein [Fimicolochytrium jonesii]KAI8818402.1 WD40-repeat-containing domain protein [Fimicolochytrium jonesii]